MVASASFSVGRVLLGVAPALIVVVGLAWWFGLFSRGPSIRRPANAMLVIHPYRHQGTWVFDDDRVGLVQEPFVAGVPEMIDVLVEDIPDAQSGFRLLFSAQEFPGWQKRARLVRPEAGGAYYATDDPPMEGWLCPALMKYFAEPPAEIYVKAEPKGVH
jgi:hypothetical protein